jgi:hypothetical protein
MEIGNNMIVKKILQRMKNGTLIESFRKKTYVKIHIKKSKNNPEKYLINLGKICLKFKMNLNDPQTFNEKLNWNKLNYHNELMDFVVDKINAKKYVLSKNLDDIIIKTIGTYSNIEDIDYNSLPNSFVVKNTLDSGGVYICKDKKNININKLKEKLSSFKKEMFDGVHWALETAYSENNKIIVEELIDTLDGHSPADYKFFCFNGEPEFLFVGTERDIDVKFDFYDINFNWLNVRQGHKNNLNRPKKPKNYERMLDICRILSKDFPHVRVDLYNIDGKIYFGELTFYHFAGLTPFEPRKWDYEFGKFFDITKIQHLK